MNFQFQFWVTVITRPLTSDPGQRHPGVRRLKLFVVMQHKSSLHSPNDRFVIALHSPDGNLQTGPPLSPPEKRAAKLAFQLQQDTFSESGLSAKHGELRGFSAIFRGKPQSFSAVETCWRREVNSNFRYSFERPVNWRLSATYRDSRPK